MPRESCGHCVFRIPLGDFFRPVAAFGEERLRCALVKGPIRGQDSCDLNLPGPYIQDWVDHDRGKKSRAPGKSYEDYKLPKGHERVNYRRRVESQVKEKMPEPK